MGKRSCLFNFARIFCLITALLRSLMLNFTFFSLLKALHIYEIHTVVILTKRLATNEFAVRNVSVISQSTSCSSKPTWACKNAVVTVVKFLDTQDF